jgi:hypothetical protein
MTGSAPLTCDFDLTGNETSSALAAGSAVEVALEPGYYAASGTRIDRGCRRRAAQALCSEWGRQAACRNSIRFQEAGSAAAD